MNTTGLRFEKILVSVEQRLSLTLEQARLETGHGPTIGGSAEAAVRAVLRDHLPGGYSVGHGHVYDAYGDESLQTDVVIANPDHPLAYPESEKPGIYVVDGVSAAGEVKATLDSSKLDDCIRKGTAFKRLRMTISPNDTVVTQNHQNSIRQMGLVPPYFAIAFDNKVAIETLLARLHGAALVPPPSGKSEGPADDGHMPQPALDIVCLLGKGVCTYYRPGNPMGISIKDGPPQDSSGWIFMPTDAPLAWTLAWLHSAMPRLFRGGSVLAPYLMPNQRHLKYMVDRGHIEAANPTPPQG